MIRAMGSRDVIIDVTQNTAPPPNRQFEQLPAEPERFLSLVLIGSPGFHMDLLSLWIVFAIVY